MSDTPPVAEPPKRSSHLPLELLDGYGRLLSLDFFRGFVMFMLMAEILWGAMGDSYFDGGVIGAVHTQLVHAQWHGLNVWDLIQPFFMFIVGVAMPISFNKRWDRGDTWTTTLLHTLKRSLILLLLGVGLYCIHNTGGPHAGEPHLSHEFWDVLAQLSFTYLVAFLIMRRSWRFQLGFSVGLLAVTEMLYRLWPIDGYNHPFVPDENFGSWLDVLITGYTSRGHWVAANAIPTAAHTIWGVMAGQLLISDRPTRRKLQTLVFVGLIGVAIGYGLDPVTPIIKRIATTSFTIVTGGWCVLALALSFWAVDVVKAAPRAARFFAVVGMNPILIYLFCETGGARWLRNIVSPFTEGFLGMTAMPEPVIALCTNAVVVAMMWSTLYFLYKRRVFVAI
ncbi:MAG: DUF5009 domain-containing protein [Phycisphaera sp.]|nr:DUF5009 domain-containing protein [Phycisphaera sp.]